MISERRRQDRTSSGVKGKPGQVRQEAQAVQVSSFREMTFMHKRTAQGGKGGGGGGPG